MVELETQRHSTALDAQDPVSAALLEQLEGPYVFVDVGARWGPKGSWRALSPPVQIVAFEPDEAECRRLADAEVGQVRYEPTALGPTSGPATLYITRDPACSSLYPPDERAIAAHPQLAVATLVSTQTVQLRPLDAWCANEKLNVDALKLDVQGAELDVLRGAEEQLRHIVMIEAEVVFNPMYRDQPLFSDVDRFLRARGFALWRLRQLVHYGDDSLDSTTLVDDEQFFDSRPVPIAAGGGQLYWANAYYVADDVLRAGSGDRVRRAAIAAGAFGYPELANMLGSRSGGVR
jgi:FkbM family methyltransferase